MIKINNYKTSFEITDGKRTFYLSKTDETDEILVGENIIRIFGSYPVKKYGSYNNPNKVKIPLVTFNDELNFLHNIFIEDNGIVYGITFETR